jgi:hypothetical protein
VTVEAWSDRNVCGRIEMRSAAAGQVLCYFAFAFTQAYCSLFSQWLSVGLQSAGIIAAGMIVLLTCVVASEALHLLSRIGATWREFVKCRAR